MSWFNYFAFSNAGLAPFLLLVSLPLILHLFAKARPPAFRFSSIEFIRIIIRHSIRLKRPQSWLVLLLRTLLFAAIILSFIQPVYFGPGRLADGFQKKDVILLMDASASMAVTDGAQTRSSAACAKASEILTSLSGSDRANIIWIRNPSQAEFPSLGSNIPYLKTLLRKASVSRETGDISGAFDLAVSMLKETSRAREIYLISDFQKTAWDGFRPVVPSGIRLISIPIGRAETPNQALTRLYSRPSTPLAREEVILYAEVENFSSRPVLQTVYLRAGEARQQQEIRLAPWQKGTAAFRCRFPDAGKKVVSASLGEDSTPTMGGMGPRRQDGALPAGPSPGGAPGERFGDPFPFDNERWMVMEVRDALRVGLCSLEPATAGCWQRTLDAMGWARVEALSPDRLKEKPDLDVLLLSGWNGEPVEQVAVFLKAGGTAVWFPSSGTDSGRFRALAGLPPASTGRPLASQKSREPFRLKIARPQDPVFEAFSGGVQGDPSRGSFRARFQIAATDLPPAEALLAYQDDMPALSRIRVGDGCCFIWNLPLQAESSNWAAQPEFLPFFIELLLKSRSEFSRSAPAEYFPGQPVLWNSEQEVLDRDVSLMDGERPVPVQRRSVSTSAAFASAGGMPPGIYCWRHRSRIVEFSVVNFPQVESDLRLQSLSELQQRETVMMEPSSSIKNVREGVSLWPLLLATAFLSAMAEIVILFRMKTS